MTVRIIGAGFSRTGTMSLNKALGILGYGKCYHMHEVFQNPMHVEVWRNALNGRLPDWDLLFNEYGAVMDVPAVLFWKELTGHYPAAKVILTVRDPDDWYASMKKTIYALVQKLDREGKHDAALSLVKETVFDGFFNQRFDDMEYAIELFEEHNKSVRKAVDPSRLLAYEVSHGWEPLCTFLKKDVPSDDFPNRNTTAQFRERASLND